MPDLDAIRARHVPILGDGSRWDACADCKKPWPCDTAIVLAALDATRQEYDEHLAVACDLRQIRAERDAALARERRLREAAREHRDAVRQCHDCAVREREALDVALAR